MHSTVTKYNPRRLLDILQAAERQASLKNNSYNNI